MFEVNIHYLHSYFLLYRHGKNFILIYDVPYDKLDTKEEYRQEIREFQKAEPMAAKTSVLILVTVDLKQVFKYQRDIMDDIKDVL